MIGSAGRIDGDGVTTRDRLLKAAQAEILATGFFEASVDRIAERAGASKQTLYGLFQSRELLFHEVLRLTMAEAGEAETPDVGSARFDDGLRAYADWVTASSAKPANLELYRANVAAAAAFPELAAELHGLRTGTSTLSSYMAGQRDAGRLPDIAPDRLANWFGVLAIGGPRQLLGLSPAAGERSVQVESLVRLFTAGWRTSAGTRRSAPRGQAVVTPPPSTPVEESGRLSAARWGDLLRSAARGFAEAGFRGTSVDQIGAASGVAKMTVYRRFGNKAGLFAAALDQAVDDLLAQRRPMIFGDDIAASLEAAAVEQDRFTGQPDHVRLLRLLVTEAPSHGDMVRRIWLRLMAPGHADLAAQFGAWHAAGRIDLPDCAIAAEQFLLLAGRGNRRLTDRIAWQEAEAVEHARKLVALVWR